MAFSRWLCLLGLAFLLTACASITPEFDPPKVNLESFRALPSEGGAPRFELKLRIANPNTQSLDIAGISYSVDVLDRELISGVTNEVPLILVDPLDTLTLRGDVAQPGIANLGAMMLELCGLAAPEDYLPGLIKPKG